MLLAVGMNEASTDSMRELVLLWIVEKCALIKVVFRLGLRVVEGMLGVCVVVLLLTCWVCGDSNLADVISACKWEVSVYMDVM